MSHLSESYIGLLQSKGNVTNPKIPRGLFPQPPPPCLDFFWNTLFLNFTVMHMRKPGNEGTLFKE